MLLAFETEDAGEEMHDIIRCQRNLYNIPRGTFPLARDLGLSWDLLAEPTPESENEFTTELVEQTQKYEPRVAIEACSFETDADTGEMKAVIEQRRP